MKDIKQMNCSKCGKPVSDCSCSFRKQIKKKPSRSKKTVKK